MNYYITTSNNILNHRRNLINKRLFYQTLTYLTFIFIKLLFHGIPVVLGGITISFFLRNV